MCMNMKKPIIRTSISAIALTLFSLLVTLTAKAQDIKGDAATGKTKNAMCIGCHGIQGFHTGFPDVFKVPKISGQSAKYIVSALNAYKAGDRMHPTMRGIATTLNDQDIADLAAFYSEHGLLDGSALPAKPAKDPSAEVDALLKKGGCVSCHGENFSKPIAPAYPKLAGQHADYLYASLKSYKIAKNQHRGRTNDVMAGMVKQFSNKELQQLANYIGSLDGDMKTIQEAKFR